MALALTVGVAGCGGGGGSDGAAGPVPPPPPSVSESPDSDGDGVPDDLDPDPNGDPEAPPACPAAPAEGFEASDGAGCWFSRVIEVDDGAVQVVVSFQAGALTGPDGKEVDDLPALVDAFEDDAKSREGSPNQFSYPDAYDNCDIEVQRPTEGDEVVELVWSQTCRPEQTCVWKEEYCFESSTWGYDLFVHLDGQLMHVFYDACFTYPDEDEDDDYTGEPRGGGGVYTPALHAQCAPPPPTAADSEWENPSTPTSEAEAQGRVETIHAATVAFLETFVDGIEPVTLAGGEWVAR